MPKAPSPQVKKIHDGLWTKFLNTELSKPSWYGSTYATCMICGAKALLPRKMGNICSRCKKEKEERVKVDSETQKFLRKNPALRRRYQY